MEILLLTDTGCEEACLAEVARWTKTKAAVTANLVRLSGDAHLASQLAYQLTTPRRVLIELTKDMSDVDVQAATLITGTIKVEAEVLRMTVEGPTGDDTMSQELIEEIGEWAHKTFGKVDLKHPDHIIFASKTPGGTVIGLDLAGQLAKRDWRIMLSRRSLKSTIAASLAIYAGVSKKDIILDPLADDGTIMIETALLLSRTSPHKFRRDLSLPVKVEEQQEDPGTLHAFCSMHQELNALKTNAKLAGVEKMINASKITLDWLDLKLEEASVDRIITHAPQSGRALNPKKAERMIGDLFSQAAYLLKKKGTMTCITGKPDELLDKGMALVSRKTVLMGKLPMEIMTFRRE